MDSWILFFIIMGSSFLLPEITRRFHIPYVTALMVAGIIIGPRGMGIIEVDDTLRFLGEIGAVFLMFTAGLDVWLSSLKKIKTKIVTVSMLNGIMPFIIGYAITQYLGYGFYQSLVIGILFISSSVGIIIPTLKEVGLISKDLGKTILAAVVFEDVGSLLLLTLVLQKISPKSYLPLPIFITLVVLLLYVMIRILPRIEKYYLSLCPTCTGEDDVFERELRFVVMILVVTSILFEALGFHAIIAGFFLGLILSDIIKHRQVFHKIHTIGYGLFIPVFFLVIGMQTNINAILDSKSHFLVTFAIVSGLLASKVLSGVLAGFMTGFDAKDSIVMGVSSIPQLSTTIVTAFAAFTYHVIDEVLLGSVIVLSIVTSFLAPILVGIACHPKRRLVRKGLRRYERREYIDESDEFIA
ncbi:MAG: cation:proton antiporter [Candidatus Altiarchaeota archaeon]